MFITKGKMLGGTVDPKEEAKLAVGKQGGEGPLGEGVLELLGVILDVEGETEVGLKMLEEGKDFGLAEVCGEAFSPQIGREGQVRVL